VPAAVQSIYFLPPLAIARIGGSEIPLDSFVWDSDPTIRGAHRTVIRPAVSLEVLADGSLRPYQPAAIQFRDRGLLRPVAPFFELWVKLQNGVSRPLTLPLLELLGGSLDGIAYKVTVANRKAQRRTGSAACAYIARVSVTASDHERKPLMAFSPHTSGESPLVFKDHPIPLGQFQAIKPIRRVTTDVDLSILRVRFTPARGEVYGPPSAIAGPASPLPPGEALPPVTLGGSLHEIVPEPNRILNPDTRWSSYIASDRGSDPLPYDSYDGANVGNNRSWGVVDDTCDGIIEAQVVIGDQRCIATTRIFSSCPDFAPDRRPFYSIADDLADRELDPVNVDDHPEDTEAELADLFARAFETASLYNLDAMRERAIAENTSGSGSPQNYPHLPQVDDRSMTAADKGYADRTSDLFPYPPSKDSIRQFRLRYAAAAQYAHASLCDVETLIDVLRSRGDMVKSLIRPPFGRFAQLRKKPGPVPNPKFRDVRVDRDTTHDMRMPPYMRDSDLNPLSITYRQYDALMQYIENLRSASESPITRKIAELMARTRKPVRNI
jgi:hypothetical protein